LYYRNLEKPMPYPMFDRSQLRLNPLAEHMHDMTLAEILPLDSPMAGLVAALCAGGSPQEAARVGNLAASVTLHQIGTTGTASRAQIVKAFANL
jgi:bifunctional ADP-heptose synthase (sugar kinase/adenylyltransferase)